MAIPVAIAEALPDMREWEDRSWFPPGPQLAICLPGEDGLASLTDAELVEVMAAARRQTAWAQARELAAIAELSRRRHQEDDEAEESDAGYRVLSAHESLLEEVATALTVTGNTAATLVHLADRLATVLPGTRAALETGRIDLPKARVICDAVDGLADDVAGCVEAVVLEQASAQTTGQLRRRAKRAVQRVAPGHFEDRRKDVVAGRRLEVWESVHGTAGLGLLDVPADDARAIHNKITAVARAVKDDGDQRSLDQIRADLATALLRGNPLPDAVQNLLTTAIPPSQVAPGPASGEHHGAADSGSRNAGPGAIRHVHEQTTPPSQEGSTPGTHHPTAATDHGSSNTDTAAACDTSTRPRLPGHDTAAHRATRSDTRLPGRGAGAGHDAGTDPGLPEADARPDTGTGPGGPEWGAVARRSADAGPERGAVARRSADAGPERGAVARRSADAGMAEALAVLVDRRLNQVLGEARATGRMRMLAMLTARAVQQISDRLTEFRNTCCQMTREDATEGHGERRYRPSARLRRVIEARHPTCVFPTCNTRSTRCDLDHTVAYDAHGATCGCNLAPLCRRHHRTKQTRGWRLFQIWPGLLIWITPSGKWHITLPERE